MPLGGILECERCKSAIIDPESKSVPPRGETHCINQIPLFLHASRLGIE